MANSSADLILSRMVTQAIQHCRPDKRCQLNRSTPRSQSEPISTKPKQDRLFPFVFAAQNPDAPHRNFA
jgi:hypothetical protein